MTRRLLLLVALAGVAPALAQNPPTPRADTLRPPPRADSAAAPAAPAVVPAPSPARQQRGDSVRPAPPVSPTGAFLRSLIVPGWGQARLGRNVVGGIFVLFEGVALTMTWKSEWQLEWARTRNKYVRSHTQEREDWLVLLAFNHLLAAADAYVGAHLYDFPGALRLQALGDGRVGIGWGSQH